MALRIGTPDPETLLGSAVRDIITGNAGGDTITGRRGDDVLIGGSGNDVISGGAGDDVLVGQADDDTITTGGGADKVGFDRGAGLDTVTDFNPARDVLALQGFDAAPVVAVQVGNLQLDFGGGDILVLEGVTDLDVVLERINRLGADDGPVSVPATVQESAPRVGFGGEVLVLPEMPDPAVV
jgi:Ca2+-binding RTX toxin-like protein